MLHGAILAIVFILTVPTVISQTVRVTNSLSRGKRLVDNRLLKASAFILVICIAAGIIPSIEAPSVESFNNPGKLASNIITAIFTPISRTATAV